MLLGAPAILAISKKLPMMPPSRACPLCLCDYTALHTPDVICSYAEPISGFDDPVTKFWQGGKKGAISRFGTDSSSLARLPLTSFVIQDQLKSRIWPIPKSQKFRFLSREHPYCPIRMRNRSSPPQLSHLFFSSPQTIGAQFIANTNYVSTRDLSHSLQPGLSCFPS